MTKAISTEKTKGVAEEPLVFSRPVNVPTPAEKPASMPTLPVSPPETSQLQTQIPAEPAEQLNTSAWKPYPEEKWNEALRELHEKEFLLYCALLDASPFIDEGRGNALVLDIKERYCYEVLRLDRHRLPLKNIIATFNDASEIVLRCGERWTACGAEPAPIRTSETTRQKNAEKNEKKAAVNEPDAENLSTFPPSSTSASSREPAADVPFAGLIQEAARWLGGELIIVRREENAENEESGEQYDIVSEN